MQLFFEFTRRTYVIRVNGRTGPRYYRTRSQWVQELSRAKQFRVRPVVTFVTDRRGACVVERGEGQ